MLPKKTQKSGLLRFAHNDKKSGSEDINEVSAKAFIEIYERSSKLPKKVYKINGLLRVARNDA